MEQALPNVLNVMLAITKVYNPDKLYAKLVIPVVPNVMEEVIPNVIDVKKIIS